MVAAGTGDGDVGDKRSFVSVEATVGQLFFDVGLYAPQHVYLTAHTNPNDAGSTYIGKRAYIFGDEMDASSVPSRRLFHR